MGKVAFESGRVRIPIDVKPAGLLSSGCTLKTGFVYASRLLGDVYLILRRTLLSWRTHQTTAG